MHLRWTEEAAADLEHITEYLLRTRLLVQRQSSAKFIMPQRLF
jgi:plasmid stabilization system protein ParE